MGSPESSIRRVSLPQEGKNAFVFSSWEQLATSFQQFTAEHLQQIDLPAGEVAAEQKKRRTGKGELHDYNKEEMDFYSEFYERPPTKPKHIETLLQQIKTSTNNGNAHATERKAIVYGRALYGSQVEVEPISQGDTENVYYRVAIGSSYFGNRLEETLEATGAQRATQPKRISIEYRKKGEEFSVDFDDVSHRLRTVFQSDSKQLSGVSMAQRFFENVANEKIIEVGQYEEFTVQLYHRHEGVLKKTGNTITAEIPKLVEGGWMPPTLDIALFSPGVKKVGSVIANKYIIIPEQLQAAQTLAERIAEAFTPDNAIVPSLRGKDERGRLLGQVLKG